MRLRLWIATLLLAATACNLTSEQPITPKPVDTEQPDVTPLPTNLPGILGDQTVSATSDPNLLPTRTPMGGIQTNITSVPAVTGSPNAQTIGTRATITTPGESSTLTGDVIQVSGTAAGIFSSTLSIELVGSDGRVIVSQPIALSNPNSTTDIPWSAAMTTNRYNGDALVRAVVTRSNNPQPITLASVSIRLQQGSTGGSVISGATGPTGSITSPANTATVSGEVIQISGMAGGITDNKFTLELVAANGTVINSQAITLTNPTYTNIVPWSAALGTNGYKGAAEIRASVIGAGGSPYVFASISVSIQ